MTSSGRPKDGLEYLFRAVGTYRVAADSLLVRSRSTVTYNFFRFRTEPEVVEGSQANPTEGSMGRVDISGEILRLGYLSYPADAPEPTEMVYLRVRSGDARECGVQP